MTIEPGILALWNDCASDGKAEYERWYMAQHLPERVGVPGFRFGRRYARIDGDREYFTFYELDAPEVLWSPEYLERLGNPTEWTQRVMQDFRNTVRTACRKAAAIGTAIGGNVVTYRVMGGAVPGSGVEAAVKADILPGLLERDGVCHTHLWIAAEEQTPSKTAETDLRGEDELMFWGIIIETTRTEDAKALSEDNELIERITGLADGEEPIVGVYQLMGILTSGMMQGYGRDS